MTKDLNRIKQNKARWKKKIDESISTRDAKFITASGDPVELLGTPEMLETFDYSRDLGFPGEFPYTRGVHHNMYRGKLWTMRQFAGFGTPEDSNKRYLYLLNSGQTGLSVAFDLPTLMGRDADDPFSDEEFDLGRFINHTICENPSDYRVWATRVV